MTTEQVNPNTIPFTIYQHDEYGYYTGNQQETTRYKGIPFRWTKAPLPEIPEGKFARLNGKLGWVIEDAKPVIPEPIPTEVTARQARLALLSINKLADVETAIDLIPEPNRSAARIEWEYATTIHRSSQLVADLGPALGLSEEQLDQLFLAASKI